MHVFTAVVLKPTLCVCVYACNARLVCVCVCVLSMSISDARLYPYTHKQTADTSRRCIRN